MMRVDRHLRRARRLGGRHAGDRLSRKASGRWIRKGQTLRTNLHYHPNGTPQTDRTRIGLYFGKGELKKEVAAALAGNLLFTIPPNAPNHELRAVYVADQDINIVSFFPHMHLRGRDMTMTATFPGGRQETLLSVPAYDFNWQLFYYPKNRVALPKRHAARSRRALRQLDREQEQSGSDQAGAVRRSVDRRDDVRDVRVHAADGVSPKPSTERSRMDALLTSFPKDSAFLIEVPFGKEPTLAVFHLPRSGDGASLYWTTVGPLIGPGPVQQLKWDGDAFEFQTALLAGPGAGFYTVTGTVAADGSIKGTMRRRGPTQPPSYEFTGSGTT